MSTYELYRLCGQNINEMSFKVMQVSTKSQYINETSSHFDGTSFKRMYLYISGQNINGSSSNLK